MSNCQNCQNFQKLSKNFKIFQQLSKFSNIVKYCQNCQNFTFRPSSFPIVVHTFFNPNLPPPHLGNAQINTSLATLHCGRWTFGMFQMSQLYVQCDWGLVGMELWQCLQLRLICHRSELIAAQRLLCHYTKLASAACDYNNYCFIIFLFY